MRPPDHGRGVERAKATQDLAVAAPPLDRGHGRGPEGAEGNQDLAVPECPNARGHERRSEGPPGSTAKTPDHSLILGLSEHRAGAGLIAVFLVLANPISNRSFHRTVQRPDL